MILRTTILILALSALGAKAQDIVILQNGERHKGKIIEQIIGQSVKLSRPLQADTVIFELTSIKSIQKDPDFSAILPDTIFQHKPFVPDYNISKFFTFIQGSRGHYNDCFGYKASFSYHPTPSIYLGIGLGRIFRSGTVDNFFTEGKVFEIETTTTITLDFNYEFWSSPKQCLGLLALTATGYHIPRGTYTNKEATPYGLIAPKGTLGIANGFYQETGLGFRYNMKENTGFLLGINLQTIHAKSYPISNGQWKRDMVDHLQYSDLLINLSFFF